MSEYGPALPPHLIKKSSVIDDNGDATSEKGKLIGPALPDQLRHHVAKYVAPINSSSDDDEDNVYGPVPNLHKGTRSLAQVKLDERAAMLKERNTSETKPADLVREEWMLELPEARAANLGLGARKFRSKEGPDFTDRSCWTNTPQGPTDKKPMDEGQCLKRKAEDDEILEHDRKQEEMEKMCKPTNSESLLDQHRKRMKKKESNKETERIPFNRDVDLKIQHVDKSRQKQLIKNAQHLNDRFSSGQAKYL